MKHQIINQGKYLLIVTERGVYEGWAYHPTSNNVYRFGDLITSFERKIIAHLPLNGSPILEGVELLPPLEEDVEKLAINEVGVDGEIYNEYDCETFIKGYNKAKKKYKYTEEDMRKAFRLFFRNNMLEIDEIIQSLSQPKMPIRFECATMPMNIDEIREQGKGFLNANTNKIKTTTTPEGYTEWIGTYLYAENI